MKVLGIVGSPRKGGNSAVLTEQVVAGAQEKWAQAEIVTISELNIGPCRACMGCKPQAGSCTQKDDMIPLLEKMKAADALVLATPIYYGDVTAQMKAWMDRCYCLMDMQFNTPLKGKKVALVTSFANPQEEMADHGLKTLAQFCAFNQMQIVGEIKGANLLMPGQAKENANLITAANALGARLAQG